MIKDFIPKNFEHLHSGMMWTTDTPQFVWINPTKNRQLLKGVNQIDIMDIYPNILLDLYSHDIPELSEFKVSLEKINLNFVDRYLKNKNPSISDTSEFYKEFSKNFFLPNGYIKNYLQKLKI